MYLFLTPTHCGTSYRGLSAWPSPFPDATRNAFCRKIHHADRRCPRLFTAHSLLISDRISTMETTSCSIHITTRLSFPLYFGFPQSTNCNTPHRARTAAQPYIARTIRTSHTPHVDVLLLFLFLLLLLLLLLLFSY